MHTKDLAGYVTRTFNLTDKDRLSLALELAQGEVRELVTAARQLLLNTDVHTGKVIDGTTSLNRVRAALAPFTEQECARSRDA